MRTAVTLFAIALAAAPSAAATRNPAAALGIASAARTPAGQASTGPAPAGQGAGEGTAARPILPVPGYQFIAAGLLLGIAGVIFAFTQQDGTPDSN